MVAEDEDSREVEIGARYVRQIGSHSTLEAMASQQLGGWKAANDRCEDGEDETFDETTDTGESIVRVDLTHEWSPRLSFATSLEGAYNFLESDAELVQDGQAVDAARL